MTDTTAGPEPQPTITAAHSSAVPAPPPTTVPVPTAPFTTPSLPPSSAVLQNALARQILKAQEKLQERFGYTTDLDSFYWIRGASNICRETNVREQTAIAQILTSELIKSNAVKSAIESHIAFHNGSPAETCSETCVIKFALKEPALYIKSTSDLTSALARYTKPEDMDVQEHVVAHLEKEVDLYLRRQPEASENDIRSATYGTTDSNGKHIPGLIEDSTIARLLDSIRSSEPALISHLDRMKLFHGTSGWTLEFLENSIRAYEQELSAHPPLHTRLHTFATVQRFRAKLQAREHSTAYRPYHLYDPTLYNTAQSTGEPPKKKFKPEIPQPPRSDSSFQYDPDVPSLLSSITELQSVTKMLKDKYQSTEPSTTSPTPTSTIPRKPSRDPTHCIRCGSSDHFIFQCTEDNDQKAAEARTYNTEHHNFRPSKKYSEHGTSLAHTWALRNTRWPTKVWLKPTTNQKKE